MSLEGILTVVAILLAVLSIGDPVQRLAMHILLPWRGMIAIVIMLFVLGFVDKLLPPWEWRPVLFTLITVGLLAAGIIESLHFWQRGIIPARHLPKLRILLKTALLENRLSEAERVLRANKAQLARIDMETSLLLFDPCLITAFFNAGSPFHLELLADNAFRAGAPNRFRESDLVMRELLKNEHSPLRSVINAQTSADEHHQASPAGERLIEGTFQNPSWYTETRADYGLIVTAIEELNSGKYDEEYNKNGRLYKATQGRSRRATCSIYHSEKAQVLGITSAINNQFEADLYSSNFFQLFDAITEHSRYDETIWESDLSNREHPTPYAYLLYTISHDLEQLVELAINAGTSRTVAQWTITPPGQVAEQLIGTWSFCIWIIAHSENKVGDRFRDDLIEAYLVFILQLGWAPQDIYHQNPSGTIAGLQEWLDLLTNKIRERFGGRQKEEDLLATIISKLDIGKQYVQKGRSWLVQHIGISGNS